MHTWERWRIKNRLKNFFIKNRLQPNNKLFSEEFIEERKTLSDDQQKILNDFHNKISEQKSTEPEFEKTFRKNYRKIEI